MSYSKLLCAAFSCSSIISLSILSKIERLFSNFATSLFVGRAHLWHYLYNSNFWVMNSPCRASSKRTISCRIAGLHISLACVKIVILYTCQNANWIFFIEFWKYFYLLGNCHILTVHLSNRHHDLLSKLSVWVDGARLLPSTVHVDNGLAFYMQYDHIFFCRTHLRQDKELPNIFLLKHQHNSDP